MLNFPGKVADIMASDYKFPKYSDLPVIDLYMDQVIGILNQILQPLTDVTSDIAVTSTMINNYVKQKLVSPPIKKKYDRDNVARLVMVILLKNVFSISEIKALLDRVTINMTVEEAFDFMSASLERRYSLVKTSNKKISEGSNDKFATIMINISASAIITKATAQGIINNFMDEEKTKEHETDVQKKKKQE